MHLPVLLDVGHSIDDHFAVAAAASSPELRLLGVTTVQDGSGSAARIVRSLLDAYGRNEVPVSAGNGALHEPQYVDAGLRALEQADLLSRRPVETAATHLMARLLTEHRDVTVIGHVPSSGVNRVPAS